MAEPLDLGCFSMSLAVAEHIERNVLTFTPGLPQMLPASGDSDGEPGMPEPIEGFTDVRVIRDPDGNLIMVDQFF